MARQIPDQAKTWLDGKAFVTVSTVDPDHGVQSSPVWVKRDGDELLMSTVRGRRKERNLSKDPRVSVVVTGPDNPYAYLEVRGEVEMTELGGRELVDELHEKYHGTRPYPYDGEEDVRVVLRLRPQHVVFQG